jgi:hypothetical protein
MLTSTWNINILSFQKQCPHTGGWIPTQKDIPKEGFFLRLVTCNFNHDFLSTRMLSQKLGHIVNFAMDGHPAIIGGFVIFHLARRIYIVK